jgi:hypothetical protein
MGLSSVNKFREMLALRAIEARLSREEPELAALLSFGHAWRAVQRRERRVLAGAVGSLAMLATLTFSFLWGIPSSASTCGQGQTSSSAAAGTAGANTGTLSCWSSSR